MIEIKIQFQFLKILRVAMINIKTGIKTSSRLLSPKPQYDISEHDTLFLKNVSNDKNKVAITLMKFVYKYFDMSKCDQEFQDFLSNHCSYSTTALINPTLEEHDEYKIFEMFYPCFEVEETLDEYLNKYDFRYDNLLVVNETTFIDEIKIRKYYQTN